MISYIFWCLAAALNSCMDKTETQIAFDTSVFKNLNPRFWSKDKSWVSGFVKGTEFHFDFWHLSKSFMIIFLAGSWVTADPVDLICMLCEWIFSSSFWYLFFVIGIHLCLLGALWIGTFNLFYNKILLYKTWKKN